MFTTTCKRLHLPDGVVGRVESGRVLGQPQCPVTDLMLGKDGSEVVIHITD